MQPKHKRGQLLMLQWTNQQKRNSVRCGTSARIHFALSHAPTTTSHNGYTVRSLLFFLIICSYNDNLHFMCCFKLIRNIAAIIAFIVMLKIVVYLWEILLMFKGIQSGAHSLFINVIELLTKSIHLQMRIIIDSRTLMSK